MCAKVKTCYRGIKLSLNCRRNLLNSTPQLRQVDKRGSVTSNNITNDDIHSEDDGDDGDDDIRS